MWRVHGEGCEGVGYVKESVGVCAVCTITGASGP